jgi:hypothetical protein
MIGQLRSILPRPQKLVVLALDFCPQRKLLYAVGPREQRVTPWGGSQQVLESIGVVGLFICLLGSHVEV